MRPRIAVTLSNPRRFPDPVAAAGKNERYLTALRRFSAEPVPVSDETPDGEREEIFAAMHGLLITGGPDIDPSFYGATRGPHTHVDPGRDAIDRTAFAAASRSWAPVLGICRGLQAINVFSGGALLQHVAGHASPPYPQRAEEATRHVLSVRPGSRLGAIVGDAAELEVNSFHHQAVAAPQLAAGLRPAGVVVHDGIELVEALESGDPDWWLIGVQCHPERTESSPPQLEGLWAAFVAAARDHADGRA
jgi:putative glutamine amidotransferase